MSSKINKLIKKSDQFGHDVELSFNNEGSSHKTRVGGIISIMIYCFMARFVWTLINKMFIKYEDKFLDYLKEVD